MRGGQGAAAQTGARDQHGGGTADPAPGDDQGGDALELDADDRRLADAVDRWVVRRLDALRAQAETVRAQFEAQLRAEAQTRDRREMGRIGLRVREQRSPPATPGAFTIEWCTYRFGRQAAANACFTTYIPKGDGDRYPKSAFRGKLRNWQRPIVDAAETRLAAIRRAARHVAQVRTQLRLAVRVERALPDLLGDDGETWAD
jgi:hypothetical protein